MRPLNQIANWGKVSKEVFVNEILPLGQPAVFRRQVEEWPVVKASQNDCSELLAHLSADYLGGNARFLSLPANEDGYFFYNKDFSGFNFERKVAPLNTVFQLMLDHRNNSKSDSIVMQSAPVNEYFKNFEQDNRLDLFPDYVTPRIWLGNPGKANTHYDDSENLACVIAGKRTFTLFPPEQIENLYIGPLENTPGGAPVSMVKLNAPDFERFPKFKKALNYALTADLEPGDVIYIPALWWHHVESSSEINGLVNYWFGGSIQGLDHPTGLDALLMGLVSIGKLPKNQRVAWKAIFDHVVMSDDEDFSYIPESIRGAIGNRKTAQSKQTLTNIKAWLKKQLG